MNKIYTFIKGRKGFTLIELIIFSAIFSLVSIIFVAMLVSITSVQLRQTASSEVNRQSQFVLETIQKYIQKSSLIETTSTPSQSLVLRLPTGVNQNSSGIQSQVRIYWETSTIASVIYLKIGSSTPEALTSSKVWVDDLTFKKYSRPDSHDSVNLTMALSYNAPNTSKKFFQKLSTTATRVSAATFDSDLVPAATTSSISLGVAGSMWLSVNQKIYFKQDGSNINIGINVQNPTKQLDVAGDSLFTGDMEITGNLQLGGYINLNPGLAGNCSATGDIGNMRVKDGAEDEFQVCLDIGGIGWRAVSTTLSF